jgi:hypothetical protein
MVVIALLVPYYTATLVFGKEGVPPEAYQVWLLGIFMLIVFAIFIGFIYMMVNYIGNERW